MVDGATVRDFYRLSAWLSPSFPVGAYTYSSGLEYAVEAGLVSNAATLELWLSHLLRCGMGDVEGIFFCHAYRAAQKNDAEVLGTVVEWADVTRPTSELALESAAQGEAFLKTMRAAWPHEGFETLRAVADDRGRKLAYSVAVGAACGFHGVQLEAALSAFLHALAANLVSSAVRAVPLGQTDAQRVTANLETVIAEVITNLEGKTLDDIGSATPMIDWTSMQHETQYTRLFRS